MHDVERGNTTWEETMGFLKVTEYRYTRFALDPATGRWAMIRYVPFRENLGKPLINIEIGETQNGRLLEQSPMVLTAVSGSNDGSSWAKTLSI